MLCLRIAYYWSQIRLFQLQSQIISHHITGNNSRIRISTAKEITLETKTAVELWETRHCSPCTFNTEGWLNKKWTGRDYIGINKWDEQKKNETEKEQKKRASRYIHAAGRCGASFEPPIYRVFRVSTCSNKITISRNFIIEHQRCWEN